MTMQEYNEMKKVHQIADEARAHKARAAAAVTETPAPAVTETPAPAETVTPAPAETVTAQETKTETAKKEAAPVKTENKPAAPVCSYAPDAVTINGKTFPARYEITETAARIIATVDDGKTAPIVIPADAPAYAELVKALAAPAAQETETPAPAETVTETAQETKTETAKEAAPVKKSKPAAKKAAKKAAAPAVETVTETPAETVTETAPAAQEAAPAAQEAAPAAAVETVTETPAPAETVTAQETETPATAENHLTETAQEADRGPKEARGPIPEKTFAGESISGRGWSIVFDSGLQRTRVIVSDPIKDKARPIIENAGFYYSRAMNSWNKKLSFRAYRAALALAETLRAALA